MPVVPAPPLDEMPRIAMLFVPELSILYRRREACHILDVLECREGPWPPG